MHGGIRELKADKEKFQKIQWQYAAFIEECHESVVEMTSCGEAVSLYQVEEVKQYLL